MAIIHKICYQLHWPISVGSASINVDFVGIVVAKKSHYQNVL